jgi:hypothetical protein
MDYTHMPAKALIATTVEGSIQTCVYQAQLLHKEFAQPLNVVIIVKTNLHTQAHAHVILFSSDLTLAAASLVEYYGLRFQIEFNFRDAKQYWGLEDFMNVTPTGVTNAANLSLFMVNVAYRLCTDVRQRAPDYSVLDLKADCRGYKYVEETIKMLPEKPEPILFAKILASIMGSATLCFSRWTQRRGRQLHRCQNCRKHRAWLLTEKALRSRCSVKPREEKVVNSGEALPLAGQVKSPKLMAAQGQIAVSPLHIGTRALEHTGESLRLVLELVLSLGA